MNNKIILASQSPRRKQLLEWAEIDFDILVQPTDETFPPQLPIPEVPVYIAKHKAIAVQNDPRFGRYTTDTAILAADTIVVINNRVIGKPANRSEAIEMLSELSGKRHQVITGVYILSGERENYFADTTEVWFHTLSRKQLEFYVDKYQPFDKAGAYAIQEWIGVVGIKRIEGDFYNVMGLPVSRVVKALGELTTKTG